MQMWTVLGNGQRLDGGAMFGNAPRALWSRWVEPDDHNRIPLACRALLVQDGARRVLVETGIGAFMEPELRERYGVTEPTHVLLESLAALGLSDADIDVVVLTHLHFDHAGGLLAAHEPGAAPRLLFPAATFVVGREAFERACLPHPRDRASFIPSLQELLRRSGRLELVDGPRCGALGEPFRFVVSQGHTPGLLLPILEGEHGPVLFASDLIPGAPWVHLPVTMGYDRFPELLIDEKRTLLEELRTRRGRIVFTHDVRTSMACIATDERGRYHAVEPREGEVVDEPV